MSYRRYALERVVWALVFFWFALTAIFFLFHRELGRPPRGDVQNNPDLRRVDDYFGESYWDFLSRLVHFSFGESFFGGGPVRDMLLEAIPPTVWVVVFALLFASLMAIPLGMVWGRHRPGRLSRPIKGLSAVLYGISLYSVGLLLIYWVGGKWSLLPLGGYCDLVHPATACGGFADWARALILPGISLGSFFGAVYLRLVSGLVRDAELAREDEDGAARRRAVLSYTKLLGRDFGFGLGLAIFVEAVFGIPGLGRMFMFGLETFDAPLMESLLIAATLLAMSVNLVVDLAVAAAEPRFRRF